MCNLLIVARDILTHLKQIRRKEEQGESILYLLETASWRKFGLSTTTADVMEEQEKIIGLDYKPPKESSIS